MVYKHVVDPAHLYILKNIKRSGSGKALKRWYKVRLVLDVIWKSLDPNLAKE
jgi:hypothetical protein